MQYIALENKTEIMNREIKTASKQLWTFQTY
jgi:hypothetical protein